VIEWAIERDLPPDRLVAVRDDRATPIVAASRRDEAPDPVKPTPKGWGCGLKSTGRSAGVLGMKPNGTTTVG
jgi:hypothetical protein